MIPLSASRPLQALLESWLKTWRERDWIHMSLLATPSWRKIYQDPTVRLAARHEDFYLARWKVSRKKVVVQRLDVPIPTENGPQFIVYADVRARVWYDLLGQERSVNVTARCVRETTYGSPAEVDDERGRWYIDPRSLLRES